MPNSVLTVNELRVQGTDWQNLLNAFGALMEEKLSAFKQQQLEEKLISPAEVCKLFQPSISKVTLTAWDQQGLLKSYRFGGRVYYKYSEIIDAGKTLKRYQAHKLKQRTVPDETILLAHKKG